jgi:aspartyl-tRNA(Asn)/glutamyl-tRNA(Gln) amidotransferase subunit B
VFQLTLRRSSQEAVLYLRKLQSLLRHIGVLRHNTEEGETRCDVNVSVNLPGEPLGTRCEVKNVNSARSVEKAIGNSIIHRTLTPSRV